MFYVTTFFFERVNLAGINVQPQHRYARTSELKREGKTDIAKTNNCYTCTHNLSGNRLVDGLASIWCFKRWCPRQDLSLIHISEPTRLGMISYAVFCLKKKKKTNNTT